MLLKNSINIHVQVFKGRKYNNKVDIEDSYKNGAL